MVPAIITAILASFFLTLILLRLQRFHLKVTADHEKSGPQKFHKKSIPRIGGVSIFIGWVLGLLIAYQTIPDFKIFLFILSALPVFFGGILEDLTKKISPLLRLLAAFTSAGLSIYFFKSLLQHIHVPWVDELLMSYSILAFLFTSFSVAGVSHAFNIVDGYNGLSSMVSILILVAIAYVSFKFDDSVLIALSLTLAGSLLGFLAWNFPFGLIFAGDGGAYLMGFSIAQISVLLVTRHPEISPWFPVLLVIYPVFETLFSMYRRKFLQGRPIGKPDSLHLHQMIYKRIIRWAIGSKEAAIVNQRNSLTSMYVWAIVIFTLIPAVLFYKSTGLCLTFILLFILCYVWLYRRIVKFKVPRILIFSQYPHSEERPLK